MVQRQQGLLQLVMRDGQRQQKRRSGGAFEAQSDTFVGLICAKWRFEFEEGLNQPSPQARAGRRHAGMF
jgi:hypothetical protein